MKKWSLDMVAAFESCQEERILDILKLGFPLELPLTICDSKNLIVTERTYCVHLASEYNFLQVLKELIIRGCNLESLDSYQRSPLMVACEAGNLEIVSFLTTTCKVSLKGFDYQGNPILHIAAINGQLPILKFLLETLSIHIKTPNLHKKTALALCRDLYALDFNQSIEKTLSYLIYKNSQNELSGVQSNPIDSIHLNHFSCHEVCKEKYYLQAGSGLFRSKMRGVGSCDFVNSKKDTRFISKKKINSLFAGSFEQVAASKCELVYKKLFQEDLPEIEIKKKNFSCQSSPILKIVKRRFESGLIHKPKSCERNN